METTKQSSKDPLERIFQFTGTMEKKKGGNAKKAESGPKEPKVQSKKPQLEEVPSSSKTSRKKPQKAQAKVTDGEPISEASLASTKKKKLKKGGNDIESTTKKSPKMVETDDDTAEKGKPTKKKKKMAADVSQEPSVETQSKGGKDARETDKWADAKSDSSGSEMEKDDVKTVTATPKFSPETLTGFRELPGKKMLIIFVLWLPRFFIPWMRDWNVYNVFILVNPDLFELQEDRLFRNDMILLGVKCVTSIACSVIADIANMRYYVYLTLLFMLLLCPISGGIVDMVLRTRTYEQHYYERWLWTIIMFRWSMAIPFILTPVQFACAFLEKHDMSRKAHYNWAGILSFLEFTNALASFWLIPAKCPTKDWIQIAVWVGIGTLMLIVIFLNFIVFLYIKETRATFITCLNILRKHVFKRVKFLQKLDKSGEMSVSGKTAPKRPGVGWAILKTVLLMLIVVPLLYMSFVFSTLERFLPDDDSNWDKHKSVSAASMMVLGKILGVGFMVIMMFVCRNVGKLSRWRRLPKFVQKIGRFKFFSMDVMVFGLPHLVNILALLVVVVRLEVLTKGYPVQIGRVHYGPIPDSSKAVVLFFNVMLSNRTVCVGSDHFRPVKIRPFRYAAIEFFDEPATVNVTITPEPGSTPAVATTFTMTNIKLGRWVSYVISISIDKTKFVKHKTGPKNYYAEPRVLRLMDFVINERKWPEWNPLLIITNDYNDVQGRYKYWIRYEGINQIHSIRMYSQSRPTLWHLPTNPYTGRFEGCCNYTIWIDDEHSRNRPSDSIIPKYTFRANSIHRWPIYYLMSYLYEPIDPEKNYAASELPVWFKLILVAETARVYDPAHIPDKEELQQDWAIELGLGLAGMAAGGVFVGVIYNFWVDPPFPQFPATCLAVFWTLWALAAEPSRLKLVEVDSPTVFVEISLPAMLLMVHVPFTALHFVAAIFFYHPRFNFRERADY